MTFLYKCTNAYCDRMSVGIKFKLDIPKGANIVKARSTFLTNTDKYAPIPYDVYIHTAMRPISYFDNCLFKSSNDYDEIQVKWQMQIDHGSSILNSDVEISTGNILQELVQKFVDDESYEPNDELLLFFVNHDLADEESSDKETIEFYGGIFAQTRPKLTVEWN